LDGLILKTVLIIGANGTRNLMLVKLIALNDKF